MQSMIATTWCGFLLLCMCFIIHTRIQINPIFQMFEIELTFIRAIFQGRGYAINLAQFQSQLIRFY